jgi:tetratricopeptide (TPR) repeat protein
MKKIKIIAIFLASFLFSGLINAQIEDAKKLTVREQYAQAEEMFKKLMVSDPGIGDVYYYYGENEIKAFYSDTITLTQTGTIVKCKKLFEKGIEKDAANPLNYIGLARLDNIAGKKSSVTENINKVNAMIPAMNVKIKKIPDPKRYALILTEMAKVHIVPGKTDTTTALPLLRRAVQADPQNAGIFITTGDAFLDIKDVNNAIMNYNLAQTADPNSPLAKLRIGYLYVRAKNLSEAIKSLEEALKIDPNFAPAYAELGFVYSLAGKPDKSKQNYLKYLQLSGNNIPAKIRYVISLFKSGDFKECITQINQIFAVDSSINNMNRVLAYSYYEVKQFDRGYYYMAKFLKNINNDPNLIIPRDYIYYGRILGEVGKADLADEELRIAISLDPANVYLFSDIANYQNKVKNYKKAIAALEDKISAKAARIRDYYDLGKYYYSDENYEKSDQTLETLLNLKDPNLKSYELPALNYQGYARVNIDSTFQTGFAKPVYEKMIERALTDTVKYSKYLVDAYSYVGSYYLLNKENQNYGMSKKYFLKVLAIDPKNERALNAMKLPDLQKAKLPDK